MWDVVGSSSAVSFPEGGEEFDDFVKNSWGPCLGDGGYTYLPYDFFKEYVDDADILRSIY